MSRYVLELEKAQFRVTAEIVHNPDRLAARLRSRSFDIVVVQFPHLNWQGAEALEILHRTGREIPLIFITNRISPVTVLELIKRGAADCIESDRIAHLSIAIRRALGEKILREERDRAEKALRHSKSHYRALLESPAYGICHCSKDGKFLNVNQSLVNMLGYSSREELKGLNLARDLIQDPDTRARLVEHSRKKTQSAPLETGWKRKDGGTLQVRLSGTEVRDEMGAVEGYNIIIEDVTGQREVEDELRKQAGTDPLTGLANYRQLVFVLDAEMTRSRRTGREFALLFLDLDHLKQINDRYGHPTGSRALCRLANVLRLCCRSIDTAARYGGDEFALILPETGAAAARHVAQRICELFVEDGEQPRLSVSVGVATYPMDAETIGSLLYAADAALYMVKAQKERDSSSSWSQD